MAGSLEEEKLMAEKAEGRGWRRESDKKGSS